MKIKLVLLFVFLRFSVISQNPIKDLSDSLSSCYLKNNKGALIIGIYDHGKEKIYYYGETKEGNKQKPDSNSIFEIGGITESFTSMLFADLCWKGFMHIDDKLNTYLPVNVAAPVYQPLICKPIKQSMESSGGYSFENNMGIKFTPYICIPDSSNEPQPILLCYLSTHTSGLPNLPTNFYKKNKLNPFADYSANDLYKFLNTYRLDKPIGFDYKHSELGIAVLGKVISLAMKDDFEKVLSKFIIDSLEMQNTRIILNVEQTSRLVNCFSQKGNATDYWTYNVFAPSGGLHSTANDMMKFLTVNISSKKNYFSNLLDYTHNSRLTPGGILADELEIALGWKISPLDIENKKIVWQNGLTGGFASYIGFVETSHTGIFILSSISKDVNIIGTEILKALEKDKLITE